jgi:hypothetical protein
MPAHPAGGGGRSRQGGGAPLDSRLLCYARAVQQAGEDRGRHEYAPQQYTTAVNYEAGNGAPKGTLGIHRAERKRAYYVMLFGVSKSRLRLTGAALVVLVLGGS